jgi:hypothetical protein
MIRNILFLGAFLALSIIFAEKSHSIEFNSLADQSSYVREKCGDPLEIGRRQDVGPVWIYHTAQGNFMYYLAFTNGRLQRIVGAPCSVDDPECFDLR